MKKLDNKQIIAPQQSEIYIEQRSDHISNQAEASQIQNNLIYNIKKGRPCASKKNQQCVQYMSVHLQTISIALMNYISKNLNQLKRLKLQKKYFHSDEQERSLVVAFKNNRFNQSQEKKRKIQKLGELIQQRVQIRNFAEYLNNIYSFEVTDELIYLIAIINQHYQKQFKNIGQNLDLIFNILSKKFTGIWNDLRELKFRNKEVRYIMNKPLIRQIKARFFKFFEYFSKTVFLLLNRQNHNPYFDNNFQESQKQLNQSTQQIIHSPFPKKRKNKVFRKKNKQTKTKKIKKQVVIKDTQIIK